MKLSTLNQVSQTEFLSITGGPLEGELWLAERIIQYRPFIDLDALLTTFENIIMNATFDEKISLIRSHPDLAPSVDTELSEQSQKEQAQAGLSTLSNDEYALFQRLNKQYHVTFDFPFVICAREHHKSSILQQFEARLEHTRAQEINIALAEVLKIIHLRLTDLITTSES